MQKLLDPTLDIVFKLLFTSGPDSDIALRDLLTAVLTPPRPIVAVTLLNPAITGEQVASKGIALDLRLELDNGAKVDIEMQARDRGAFPNRALYYWAKLYGGQLERGDSYAELRPAISVLFLDYRELPGERLHSTFHVLETHDHVRLSDAFEMHLIELPKLDHAALAADRPDLDPLLQWTRFFAAKTDEDRKKAAMSNPAIQKAQSVLERLSADPDAQQLASQRELALQTYRIEMSAALDKGRTEGRRETLRTNVLDLCEAYGLTPTEEQHAELQRLDADALDALRVRIKSDRRWALGRFLMAESNNKTSGAAAEAAEDPAILKAQSILERLSADPAVRELVRQRERALIERRLDMSQAYFEGLEKGLRMAILDTCEAYGIAVSPEQQAELERLDSDRLGALRIRIKKDRCWA